MIKNKEIKKTKRKKRVQSIENLHEIFQLDMDTPNPINDDRLHFPKNPIVFPAFLDVELGDDF
jgi:hypothetical protein